MVTRLKDKKRFAGKNSRLAAYAVNEYEVLASICEKSYFEFFRHFHSCFIEEDIIYNWHIRYLCNEIQKVAERIIKWVPNEYDLIVNVPPGMTKSSIFSVCLCPWMWTRMRRFKMICVTHTDMLGQDLSQKSRDIVLSEKYQKCWPHLTLRADQNTKNKWNNNFGGWRLSVTVGGRTPTGFHAHWIDIDDPIDPEKAKSMLEIKSATEYCRRTLPSRRTSAKKSHTSLVMQRLDNDDPTGDRLRNVDAGPVKHICLPCDDSWEISPSKLRRQYRKQGGLLDPERLSKQVLKRQNALGNFYYAGQYGQNPLPRGGIIFDVDKFDHRTTTQIPEKSEWKRIIRYWDKAYSEGSGAYTAGVKLGLTKKGIYWVLDVIRVQMESHSRERLIRKTAERDGREVVIYVEQEPAAGKESVQNTIRNLAGFVVHADRRGGAQDTNKIMRADPFATQVNAGNVWLKESAWNDNYIEELRYFSEKAKYKDQVDASSGAFNLLAARKVLGAFK